MAKILIVDDSTVMRKNLEYILKGGGHQVVGQAADGKQAVSMYSQLNPDLVTMDISMPNMSGVDAVGHIINKNPDAKVVMISALNQKQMVYEALDKGAKHYIIKPIDPENLLSVIDEVLRDNDGSQEIEEKREENVEIKPGFKIDNVNGKFIVSFNENLDIKDQITLDTAVKGLLFIRPLSVVFDFGDLEDVRDEVIHPIIRLGNYIRESGGELQYSARSEALSAKITQEGN